MVASSLITPDPYRLPGYLGYVPQFKFKIGSTYGRTTHDILHDPNEKSSRIPYRLVDREKFMGPMERTRKATEIGWSNPKFRGNMVPGYTGYIPKGQHFFGQCYAQSCDVALKTFEKELVVKQNDEEMFRTMNRTSLRQFARPSEYPVKPREFPHGTSPYKLPSTHSEHYFVSGYTGFVPRARELLAKSYPEITNKALDIHKGDREKLARTVYYPQPPNSARITRARTAPPSVIYARESGLIPNYTGHVPAIKFKFGNTYGTTTVNALNH